MELRSQNPADEILVVNEAIMPVEEVRSIIRDELSQQLTPLVKRVEDIESTLLHVAKKNEVYTKEEADAIEKRREENYRQEMNSTYKRIEDVINTSHAHTDGLIDSIASIAGKLDDFRKSVKEALSKKDEEISQIKTLTKENSKTVEKHIEEGERYRAIVKEELGAWKEIAKSTQNKVDRMDDDLGATKTMVIQNRDDIDDFHIRLIPMATAINGDPNLGTDPIRSEVSEIKKTVAGIDELKHFFFQTRTGIFILVIQLVGVFKTLGLDRTIDEIVSALGVK